MKSRNYCLFIILSLLITSIISIDDSSKLLAAMNETAQQIKKLVPSSYKNLIQNLMGITDLINDSFDRNNPDILKLKYPFIPVKVVEKFKALKFTDTVTISNFTEFVQKDNGRGITFIAAAKWDGQKIRFVYMQSDVHGELKQKEQCEEVEHKEPKFLGLFDIFSWSELVCMPASYNEKDLDIIRMALESKSWGDIKRKLLASNSEAEFIMTQSVELNSLSGNSICKIMQNGQLYIGDKKYSTNLKDAQKNGLLLGLPQKIGNAPFTLELSVLKKNVKEVYQNVQSFDENGNLVNIDEEYINRKNNNFRNGKIVEVTNIQLVDKNRKVYFSIEGSIGERPYRFTMTENNVLLLSDYDWTPIYDSAKLYANKVEVILPQGHRFYSNNNKYYIYLSNSGNFGLYSSGKSNDKEIWLINKNYTSNEIPGPYNLILENNGELKIENYKREILWTNGVNSSSLGKKQIIVTDDGKFEIIDGKSNGPIFDSSKYIQVE